MQSLSRGATDFGAGSRGSEKCRHRGGAPQPPRPAGVVIRQRRSGAIRALDPRGSGLDGSACTSSRRPTYLCHRQQRQTQDAVLFTTARRSTRTKGAVLAGVPSASTSGRPDRHTFLRHKCAKKISAAQAVLQECPVQRRNPLTRLPLAAKDLGDAIRTRGRQSPSRW